MNFRESLDPGVLIVAYRRVENVKNILEQCAVSGVKRIYITIDSPKMNSCEETKDFENMKNVVRDFKFRFGAEIEVHARASIGNLGCSVSFLSGCDWAFATEKSLIVIEDDCLPSERFFDFFRMFSDDIDLQKNVLLICGTQFAPSLLTGGKGLLSKYPLTWGWGTSKESWKELRKLFWEAEIRTAVVDDLVAFTPERAFWSAAKRRAIMGFTDVWDSVVVEHMVSRNLFAVLPPHNFILNNGNDSVATNVPSDSEWTHQTISTELLPRKESLVRNPTVESWIRKNCYGISIRHLFSTKITLCLDLAFRKRRKFKSSLRDRLFKAVNFEHI